MKVPKEVLEHAAGYRAFLCYECGERITFASQGDQIWTAWIEPEEESEENEKLPIEEMRQVTFSVALKCNSCEEEFVKCMDEFDPDGELSEWLQNLTKNDATEEEISQAKVKIRALNVMREATEKSQF
jgi:hypothetical protein